VHSVCSTAASVSDVHMLPELLHGDEKKVWAMRAIKARPKLSTRLHRNAQDMISRRVKTKAGVD